MITISNVQLVNGQYTASVNTDGKVSTMTFASDPSQFSSDLLETMHSQVQTIRMENMPEYIQQLATQITLPAYVGMTDQQIMDSLNAATITKYTPVPVDTMITALVTIGAYPKLRDAETDKNDPSHAIALDLLALMNPPVATLDFSLPAASMLMDGFVETGLATAEDMAYIKTLGIAMINWPTSIGYLGSITLTDITSARG